MNARRDCPVGAAVGARRERSNRRSRHGSQTQIEPSWDNQFRAEQQSPAMPEDHASTKREIRGNGNGNAEIPGRGPATGRRERAAFVTARGGNESEMETARDTARGFETDYMSTAEPDTGRSLSTAFEDEPESSRGGAPAYGFPSYRNTAVNRTVNAGRAPIDRRNVNAGSGPIDLSSDSRGTFTASPASWMARDDEYRQRSRHKAEIYERRPNYSNTAERAPVKAKMGEQHQFVFRQDLVEDIFSYARHNRVEDLERMMDNGVPADVRDDHGNTILIVACQNGHKRALKAALRRGADINATNARGNTALHFCHAFGYGDTLGRYLVDKGASASIRNRAGMVCYDGIGR